MSTERQPEFVACIVCGARGSADAILNLILFVPLGVALALGGRTGFRPLLYAALLSSGIELAQLVIPGRDPSLGDVCFNTLGATVGQVGARVAWQWVVPEDRTAARLSAGASVLAVFLFGLTAALLAPTFPSSTYHVRWTHALPELEWYHCRVLQAALGPLPLRSNDFLESRAVRPLLLAGVPIRLEAIAGPQAPGLGQLLSIHDEHHHEIVLIGPDRDDLVLRYGTRAAALRLDQPDLRLRGALTHVAPGDTLRIEAWHNGNAYCLVLNHIGTCSLGFTLGSGWGLLLYPEHVPAWLQELLGAAWVAALVLPMGLWARWRPETLLATGMLLVGLFVLPRTAGLLPTPPAQILGAAGGCLLGVGLRSALRVRVPVC